MSTVTRFIILGLFFVSIYFTISGLENILTFLILRTLLYRGSLRYHGVWILPKNVKNIFFAVQIEETNLKINILQN